MALWMEEGSCPATDQEIADLDAIAALKEASAIEYKEEGNQYVKMGKKHYASALDCYSRAINQKALGDTETSILFSNRAHVNLLLGNYRRALKDSEQAIRLFPDNLKAYYRAAKAAFSLDLTNEAASFCKSGIERFPGNDELKKLESQINAKKVQLDIQRNEVSQAVSIARDLASAIESRGFKIGKAMYRDLSGSRKPTMDERRVLHWPVLLLYAEVMSSDLIENFSEDDIFSDHLDMMFSGSSLPWDSEGAYNRQAVELYYQARHGIRMSRKETLKYLLEGTAGAVAADHLLDDDDDDEVEGINDDTRKWVKVNEKKKLSSILCQPDYIIPGVPVFFVVSKSTAFYREFKAGKWNPP